MKDSIFLAESIKSKLAPEKREDQKNISFTQFSVYETCKYRWYLTYAKGNYLFNASIHTVFGTAIHEAIQTYLKIAFLESVQEANDFDILELFERRFKEEYKKEKEANNGMHFSTKEEMSEFYGDGVEILKDFKKKNTSFFSKSDYELLGVEIPLSVPIRDDSDSFLFQGYIDLVLKHRYDDTIVIEDFKTSSRGWTKKEKGDETKQSKLLLYKKYFGKQFGVDPERIVPRFRILKRKLWEEADFPQSRIQAHEPANGKIKMNAAAQRLSVFINECFEPNGKPKDKIHPKQPSPQNCKYCPFKDLPEFCDKKL